MKFRTHYNKKYNNGFFMYNNSKTTNFELLSLLLNNK